MLDGEKTTYFYDSYAIIEILRGNENYLPYIDKFVVLTKLNLFEIFYSVLKDFGEEKAKEVLQKYYPSAVDFGAEVIQQAAKLRLEKNRRELSMTDCIGYIISKRLKIKFLTGDNEFWDMENVQFVK